jgi:sulfide:quinone oxidoreductase
MSIARLSPTFSVSPQLGLEELAPIAAAGFRAIVNNRPDDEAPDQPKSLALEAEAKRLGLAYAYIPIVPGQMDEKQVRSLEHFLAEVDGPVLGFCRTGLRAASLWALVRAHHSDVDDILKTAARAGYDLSSLRPRLEDASA